MHVSSGHWEIAKFKNSCFRGFSIKHILKHFISTVDEAILMRISAIWSKNFNLWKKLFFFDFLLYKEGSSECGRSETWSYVENVGTGWYKNNLEFFYYKHLISVSYFLYFFRFQTVDWVNCRKQIHMLR